MIKAERFTCLSRTIILKKKTSKFDANLARFKWVADESACSFQKRNGPARLSKGGSGERASAGRDDHGIDESCETLKT